jgi:antitoxin CptB
LLYRSAKRGLREADLILKAWAEQNLHLLDITELLDYEQLLQESDVDILNWLTKRETVPDKFNNSVMSKLLSFESNYEAI